MSASTASKPSEKQRSGPRPYLRSDHQRDKGIACALFASGGWCPVVSCPYMHCTADFRKPLPTEVCNFFRRYRCLRDDCPYYHLPQDKLDALIASGATDYCPLDDVPMRDPLSKLDDAVKGLAAGEITGARAIGSVPDDVEPMTEEQLVNAELKKKKKKSVNSPDSDNGATDRVSPPDSAAPGQGVASVQKRANQQPHRQQQQQPQRPVQQQQLSSPPPLLHLPQALAPQPGLVDYQNALYPHMFVSVQQSAPQHPPQHHLTLQALQSQPLMMAPPPPPTQGMVMQQQQQQQQQQQPTYIFLQPQQAGGMQGMPGMMNFTTGYAQPPNFAAPQPPPPPQPSHTYALQAAPPGTQWGYASTATPAMYFGTPGTHDAVFSLPLSQ